MHFKTISSRAFNQDTSGAKRASNEGPVIITERGRPAHVLLSYAEFERIRQPRKSVAEVFAMPEGADLDIEFPRRKAPPRAVDIS